MHTSATDRATLRQEIADTIATRAPAHPEPIPPRDLDICAWQIAGLLANRRDVSADRRLPAIDLQPSVKAALRLPPAAGLSATAARVATADAILDHACARHARA